MAPNPTCDVIGDTHFTLTVGADGSHAERFLSHVNVPGIADALRCAPENVQLYWIIRYWEDQLNRVGLDGYKFTEECSRLRPLVNRNFIRFTSCFICDLVERHQLPIVDVPLRPVGIPE